MLYSFDLLIWRKTLSRKSSHTAFETNILSLDIISSTKEKSERVNEIEREPEAWGAVRFKFVRITSSHLLSVRPWCDGLICLALPVVTVYVRVLRETVQIEKQWAVQHFTPQPERGYLIWKQTHTHTALFSGWGLLNILSLSHYCFDPCQEQWAQTAGK